MGAAAWVAAATLLATPIAVAENLARDADSDAYTAVNLSAGRDPARGHEMLIRAAGTMWDASRRLPWNGDYAARAARLQIAAGIAERDPRTVKQSFDAAVNADGSSVQNLSMRAQFEMLNLKDPQAARHDYERALTLDPNNVRLRLDYARQLQQLALALKRPRTSRQHCWNTIGPSI